ncbi:MAG: hypothetical protein BWY09_03172 [Candidatus Hydrogenedentes bacterium ADurb.Bin179]|nr:MAG: hypothetical protein BWY09_03172 [Candidatus Hydrogenedentes bacterium ADurb.Bin179]
MVKGAARKQAFDAGKQAAADQRQQRYILTQSGLERMFLHQHQHEHKPSR